MKQSPKVLILILSTKDKRYKNFIEACKNTWIKLADHHSVNYLFYQGGANNDYLDNNTINLKVDDSLNNTGLKLIRVFQYLKREGIEYDYIFRTNLSSFIYVNNLLRFIKQNQDINLYSGYSGKYTTLFSLANRFDFTRRMCLIISKKDSIEYASGSGFILSYNIVQKILEDQRIRTDLVDDVMIGECLKRHNIKLKKASRIELNDNKITYSKDITESYRFITDCYHIRLKSQNRAIDVNRFYILVNYQSFPSNFQEVEKSMLDNVNQI